MEKEKKKLTPASDSKIFLNNIIKIIPIHMEKLHKNCPQNKPNTVLPFCLNIKRRKPNYFINISTCTLNEARLNPSGVKPYLFHTLKKAACVRIAGAISPYKTLEEKNIMNISETNQVRDFQNIGG